jgi:hypothetical protein
LLHQLPGYIIYGGLYYQDLNALEVSSGGLSATTQAALLASDVVSYNSPYLEAAAINAATPNQAIALISATVQSPAAWGAYWRQVDNPDEDLL